MPFTFSGSFVHFAAIVLLALFLLATWTARALSRLPTAIPRATSASGKPEQTPPQPQAEKPEIRAQPKAVLQPSNSDPESDGIGIDQFDNKPAPVEFSIYAPVKAPPDFPIDIRINISIYDDEFAEVIKTAGYKTFETLVLDLRRGDVIRLELQPQGIELDAPEQTVVWNGRDITVVFVGRLPASARTNHSFTTSLMVYMWEIPLGSVSFSITCDERAIPEATETKQIWSRQQIQDLARRLKNEGKGFGAFRYKRIFISHDSSDSEEVSYINDVLFYSGIKTVYAPTSFYGGPQSWKEIARDEIMHSCHAMLLCWSEAARRNYYEKIDSPIKFEMDLALQREADTQRPRFGIIPYQLGNEIITLPIGYSERPMNSPALAARISEARKKARASQQLPSVE